MNLLRCYSNPAGNIILALIPRAYGARPANSEFPDKARHSIICSDERGVEREPVGSSGAH